MPEKPTTAARRDGRAFPTVTLVDPTHLERWDEVDGCIDERDG